MPLLLDRSSHCDICFENFLPEDETLNRRICTLHCGHSFCTVCIRAIPMPQKCPLCRKPFLSPLNVAPLHAELAPATATALELTLANELAIALLDDSDNYNDNHLNGQIDRYLSANPDAVFGHTISSLKAALRTQTIYKRQAKDDEIALTEWTKKETQMIYQTISLEDQLTNLTTELTSIKVQLLESRSSREKETSESAVQKDALLDQNAKLQEELDLIKKERDELVSKAAVASTTKAKSKRRTPSDDNPMSVDAADATTAMRKVRLTSKSPIPEVETTTVVPLTNDDDESETIPIETENNPIPILIETESDPVPIPIDQPTSEKKKSKPKKTMKKLKSSSSSSSSSSASSSKSLASSSSGTDDASAPEIIIATDESALTDESEPSKSMPTTPPIPLVPLLDDPQFVIFERQILGTTETNNKPVLRRSPAKHHSCGPTVYRRARRQGYVHHVGVRFDAGEKAVFV